MSCDKVAFLAADAIDASPHPLCSPLSLNAAEVDGSCYCWLLTSGT
jgi:hypothetical protein